MGRLDEAPVLGGLWIVAYAIWLPIRGWR